MINLKAVRDAGKRPRVHGNGFIQLDLTEESRLHVWGDPRIPRQKSYTPIHDHVFGFESTIIVGRLLNVIYGINRSEHGDYRIYTPTIREDEDTVLGPTDICVTAYPVSATLIDWNTRTRSYYQDPFIFHETFVTGPAATIITKDGKTQAQGAEIEPRVLVRVDQQPDNEFNRYTAAPEDKLWRIIEDTMKLRRK